MNPVRFLRLYEAALPSQEGKIRPKSDAQQRPVGLLDYIKGGG